MNHIYFKTPSNFDNVRKLAALHCFLRAFSLLLIVSIKEHFGLIAQGRRL